MRHDWITLHRLDFDAPMAKEAVVGPELPGAEFTRTCMGFCLDEAGDLLESSRTWGVMGVFA
jgi:hypothetical protein